MSNSETETKGTGIGSNNSALGQGSIGTKSTNQQQQDQNQEGGNKKVEGGAGGGGRESGDQDASISGDTSSGTNINNETPETTSETIDPSSSVASDEYSAEGSSSATSAGQKGVAGMGSHTSLASTGIESQEPQEGGYGTRGVEHENRNKDGSEIIGQEANSESIKEDLGEVENARERVHKY